MTEEQAETYALRALAWLAGNDELLPVFMGSSGSSIDSLAALAKAPEALGSVLDFLMMDDNWVLAYAAYDGSDPLDMQRARMVLPGGNEHHWT